MLRGTTSRGSRATKPLAAPSRYLRSFWFSEIGGDRDKLRRNGRARLIKSATTPGRSAPRKHGLVSLDVGTRAKKVWRRRRTRDEDEEGRATRDRVAPACMKPRPIWSWAGVSPYLAPRCYLTIQLNRLCRRWVVRHLSICAKSSQPTSASRGLPPRRVPVPSPLSVVQRGWLRSAIKMTVHLRYHIVGVDLRALS